MAESLNVGNPANNATQLPEVADPRFECQLELPVADILPYDRNPRRADNPKFSEIKESIRAAGIRNPLTVTRRPGEQHFIVESGGNTRLVAIQQLWLETKEPQFQKITVMFRPWRSESRVLVAHLAENDQRGDLTYWDKANGVMALKAELETELARPLPLRQFEEELKQRGLSISRSSLARFQFAIDRLGALGQAHTALTGLDIKNIQPRLNLIKRYAEKRAGINESDLYTRVLNPVFERTAHQYANARTFNAVKLCEDCEQALAQCLEKPVGEVRMQLDALEKSPGASSDGERQEAPIVPAEFSPNSPSPAGEKGSTVPASNGAQTPANEPSPSHSRVRSAVPGTDRKNSKDETPPRSASVESEPRRDSEPSDMVERLKQRVISFARLTDVADCLHLTKVTACGFYMEPPETPLDLDPGKPYRRWAWWVLAFLSGQMREDVGHQLPESSSWRRLYLSEGEDEDALPLLLENELAAPVGVDLTFVDWLTDPGDEAATILCEIVTSVRGLRAESPPRTSTPDDRERQSRGR